MSAQKIKIFLNIISILLIGLISFTVCYHLFYRYWTPNTYANPNEEIKFEKDIIRHSVISTVTVVGKNLTDNQSSISRGSGFFISNDGIIITNQHVIDDCDFVMVIDYNGSKYRADIISTDKRSDIAVIKIDIEDSPYLTFANLEDAYHGQPVFTLGNPLNYATDGNAVVAVGRITKLNSMSFHTLDFSNDRFYSNLIQINAATYMGNSGGPLLDRDGHVIGIMTVAVNSITNPNVGFAIAIDDVFRNIIGDLSAGKTVKHGFLGTIHDADIPADLIKQYNLSDLSGAFVSLVLPGSPAQYAGIQKGDIIKKIDSVCINDRSDLIAYINIKQPGSKVNISLLRPQYKNLKNISVTAKLENRTIANRNGYFEEKNLPETSDWGLTVKPISKWRREKSHIPENIEGVIVYDISLDGPFKMTDIQPGDIITHINGKSVSSIYMFSLAARESIFTPKIITWNNRTKPLPQHNN